MTNSNKNSSVNQSEKSRIVNSEKAEIYRRVMTIVLLLIVMVVCFVIPTPTASQWKIINALTAITLAFLSSEITGFFDLNIPKFVKAGGAIAVFAFVFWINKDYTPPIDREPVTIRIEEQVYLSPKPSKNQETDSTSG